jgi:hypothetical protein
LFLSNNFVARHRYWTLPLISHQSADPKAQYVKVTVAEKQAVKKQQEAFFFEGL